MKILNRLSPVIGASVLIILSGCGTTTTPGSISSRPDQPLADQRNLIDDVRISQDDINVGSVAFEDLFYAGKHIFSNRFTSEDHYGEGAAGPRQSKYMIDDREGYPFLRFNGLDSQSCLECHLSVGFAPQKNYPQDNSGIRFAKQPGFTGGGAGSASNAFGLANFACKSGNEGCDSEHSTTGFIRNPPHAFGAGYTQTLAEEMSWQLLGQLDNARDNPGTPVPLTAKGVSFGTIVVDDDGNADFSNVEGVSEDLIVRPFQWRGIAQNLRNFVRDAMNFHFSVQPREFLAQHPEANDNDGEDNEILEGEITAVTTFLAFLRPPVESSDGLDVTQVEQGRNAFGKAGCDSCHVPSLPIDEPVATIRDPRMDVTFRSMMERQLPSVSLQRARAAEPEGETFITMPSRFSPTLQKALGSQSGPAARAFGESAAEARAVSAPASQLYSRNLNQADGPPETLPRLPGKGGKLQVPLYSDLKRHRMGTNLAESFAQSTDGDPEVVSQIPGNVFLTRPLWGVADTGPWLHDGRALTLREAIVMHRGDGSEANSSIDKYENVLSESERYALRVFLSSLRLPVVH